MRVFAREGSKVDGDFAETSQEIINFAEAHQNANVYVAPNPTSYRGGARHTARDVTHWSYLLIDMDPVETNARPDSALLLALRRLSDWTGIDVMRQTLAIDSGRGHQAWIRLADHPLVDDPNVLSAPMIEAAYSAAIGEPRPWVSRRVARRVSGYWLKRLYEELDVVAGCRIDTSVSDLPRVMRCPGTVNQKTKGMARIINWSAHRYHDLAGVLVRNTPKHEMEDPPAAPRAPSGARWTDTEVFSHLTRSAQDYLRYGQEEPGRHKVMWHTAKKFEELGVGRDEARRALAWANALRGEDNELPADQVEHALDTAYGPA